jgi:hypothetical protein
MNGRAAFAPDGIAFIESLPDNGNPSIKMTRSTDGKVKRVVPEEGQNVLPEDSTPWGEGAALIDIAFEPVSSNRSLRCGETEFQRGDKEAETTLEIQRRRCRDKITLGNSANSGLIARWTIPLTS